MAIYYVSHNPSILEPSRGVSQWSKTKNVVILVALNAIMPVLLLLVVVVVVVVVVMVAGVEIFEPSSRDFESML
jgi:phosphatidylglycerophosphate synthase